MKILICEEEEVLLTAIEFRLQKNGFSVIRTNDAQQCVKHLQEDHPDMLIIDLDMSGISGLEMTDKLRKEMNSDIPIILLSDLEDGEELHKAFEFGANDFVTKPFKPVELVIRIKKLFMPMTA
ncbi:MAG: response regulator transcription factor [Bacteroidia bacterium]|nr:response regulator transcription factor [Bacteroidia bacterium]